MHRDGIVGLCAGGDQGVHGWQALGSVVLESEGRSGVTRLSKGMATSKPSHIRPRSPVGLKLHSLSTSVRSQIPAGFLNERMLEGAGVS